jgi:carbon-monoxide dehydrogenase medium subunit
MKPAPFEYFQPRSIDEALSILAQHGSAAKPLAGGQSLIPAMNFRLSRPAVLVDLNAVHELAFVRSTVGSLHIGAMTRQAVAERDPLIAERAPLLKETMPFIAHAQIRNRGTIGGSLAHADPAAELPSVMVALDATFDLRGPRGDRAVRAEEFYTGLFETALAPGELLVEIGIPQMPARSGYAFLEISRRHGDFALSGVACRVTLNEKGKCSEARIALVSVGDGPVLAKRAMKALAGEAPGEKVIAEAADLAGTKDCDPPSDIHASAAYRRKLTSVLVRRAVTKALAVAVAGGSA